MEKTLETAPSYLGECFTTMGERFMMYERYYTNHPHAVEYLQVRAVLNNRVISLLWLYRGCGLGLQR